MTPQRATQKRKRKTPAEVAHERPKIRTQEVLDVAADIFARRGYAGSTIQEVADELGILKGSIYYYIKSKEDLLLRLLEEVHEDVEALVASVVEEEGLTALERLERYARAQVEYNLRNVTKISVYYDNLEQLPEDSRKKILARRRIHEDVLVDILKDGQREGSIDPDRDVRLMAFSVFSTIVWPYRWYRPRGRVKAADVAEACVDFVMHGVAPR